VKLKVLLMGVTAALLSVSVAVAAPPPGKGKPASPGTSAAAGKPATTGPGCRPMVTVVLKGTITGTTSNTLTMTVTRANRWGRAYLTAGSATVNTTPDTKVRRNGGKLLTDLKATDWVLVQARVCKAELLAPGAPLTLTAVRVVAHPAKA
jgi:hypothetical protein